ncbi:hypothetical protein EPD60_15420 [Flaviaesturariibacter flavus]|uniref:Peptidase C39-like domain-containing protein n=1 Tax=Flaviaesturariibacter flavus TaxID=2502780 RepID=A0A4R1B8Q2_9BACT|nr:C39 family peptidase [Flaviaesturariibacter flavus]TCJ12653.1 hypothetical protein EPD60_15420 [Flaviaesturariibacter flavus]
MKLKLFLPVLASICFTAAHAQNCDPWIKQAYKELFGREPNGTECNIRNYNNGSWNSYDQLKGYIKTYNKTSGGTPQFASNGKQQAMGHCGTSGYNGICAITEFTNDDFPVRNTTCGQAAAVTAMWHAGLGASYGDPKALAKSFYGYAPPKITVGGLVEAKGSLGTDWRQINYGLDGYKSQGIRYNWQKGIDALKNELRKNVPCLFMLDTGTLPQYGYKWFTGHWVVAYGYDSKYVYVTNFPDNKMTWDELKKAWGGVWNEGNLAKAHGTAEMFAAVWKQ